MRREWPVRENLEEWVTGPREAVTEKGDGCHLPSTFQFQEHFLRPDPWFPSISTICTDSWDSVSLLISCISSSLKRKKPQPRDTNHLPGAHNQRVIKLSWGSRSSEDQPRTFGRPRLLGLLFVFSWSTTFPHNLPCFQEPCLLICPSYIFSSPPALESVLDATDAKHEVSPALLTYLGGLRVSKPLVQTGSCSLATSWPKYLPEGPYVRPGSFQKHPECSPVWRPLSLCPSLAKHSLLASDLLPSSL